MFHSARLKLTIWYLLIIMLISVSFSAVIYVTMSQELERGLHRVEIRLKAEELDIPMPRQFPTRLEDLPPRLREISPRLFFVEDLEGAKRRLILNLLVINGVILGISAAAGYFLAGKTLKPIEKAMEEQKRFVADASHELRTPLTALKTSMEVDLRDKKMSLNEAKNLIKSNLEDINSLQVLTNNLLNLTRYQDNGENFTFQNVDLAEIIQKASQKILPLAKEKDINLKLKVNSYSIRANKESLEEMMVIFLDNGVKYTEKGGEVVVTTSADKKHVVIKTKDTGIGISETDLPHVFDRFYRADQSRSKNEISGFGLGLSLAKKIIEIHKGSVEVISTLGKGTTFTIKLPRKYS